MSNKDIKTQNGRNNLFQQKPAFYIILALIILLGVYAIITTVLKTGPFSKDSPEGRAWTVCTTFIEHNLEVPDSEAQDFDPSGVTLVGEEMYQVDISYPKTGVQYRCVLKNTESGSWALTSLEER